MRASATVGTSFTLTDPHLFDTTLTQDVSQGFGLAMLVDATRGEIFRRAFGVNFEEFGALMGALDPGDYRLSVVMSSFAFAEATHRSSASHSERSSIDLGLTLTPLAATPEPATFALLATGLCGLAARRRASRKSEYL
jgi:hypothetical protein